MQRTRGLSVRLDVVLAGVVLLLLFSLLPFFFQQQINVEPTAEHNGKHFVRHDGYQQEIKLHQKRPHDPSEEDKTMEGITIKTPSAFDDTLETFFKEHDETVLVYLYGNIQAATGKSWCPDCAAADAPIRAAAAEAKMRIIEAPVGERHEYKQVPTNPYRIHPQVRLVAVPTIIKWTRAGPGGRLVENECRSQSHVAAFLAEP